MKQYINISGLKAAIGTINTNLIPSVVGIPTEYKGGIIYVHKEAESTLTTSSDLSEALAEPKLPTCVRGGVIGHTIASRSYYNSTTRSTVTVLPIIDIVSAAPNTSGGSVTLSKPAQEIASKLGFRINDSYNNYTQIVPKKWGYAFGIPFWKCDIYDFWSTSGSYDASTGVFTYTGKISSTSTGGTDNESSCGWLFPFNIQTAWGNNGSSNTPKVANAKQLDTGGITTIQQSGPVDYGDWYPDNYVIPLEITNGTADIIYPLDSSEYSDDIADYSYITKDDISVTHEDAINDCYVWDSTNSKYVKLSDIADNSAISTDDISSIIASVYN